MAYNEHLANRIREKLVDLSNIIEKEMMGGLAFMLNDKMCVGVVKEEMMCRIDPELMDDALEKNGCRPMNFTGKPMKGWVFVDEFGVITDTDLMYWIGLAIEFNSKAKKSSKRKA